MTKREKIRIGNVKSVMAYAVNSNAIIAGENTSE